MIFIAFGLGVLVILIILELSEAQRLRKENKFLKEYNKYLRESIDQFIRSADNHE